MSTQEKPAKQEVGRKKCFFIAPIGASGSDTRRRSDQILRHVIKPAIEGLGYSATRADDIDGSGMITTQVLERILNDELVIADLTDQNPNVFYELAVRHALRKPFIQIVEEGQTIPFDVQGLRVIEINHKDLDSAAAARSSLSNAVAAIESGTPVDTPMTYALDLQDLRGSGKAEERGLADILDAVKEIQRQVAHPRTQPESRSAREVAELKEFIEWVARRKKIDREDLESLFEVCHSKFLKSWVREIIERQMSDTHLGAPL
ncbi:hypothetical protein OG588_33850 [Streptomyces prunicolor]|uniref:hypothetical protein n=1 Tax=Streptomyces prunicolor TaxID=67348 RepID=UPI0038676CE8|nr:hypothetical protein OG588_33850 [Streptomyces prunicolor]